MDHCFQKSCCCGFCYYEGSSKDDPEFKFEDLKSLENPFDEAARDVLFKRLNVEKTR